MNEFKVGDIIIGNRKNRYLITNENNPCKVVQIIDGEYLWVKLVRENKNPNYYMVESCYFRKLIERRMKWRRKK